jgi:hypothetical protein
MKATASEVKRRNRQLRTSFAKVSERMVYLWYRGERTSQRVQAAHDALTVMAREQSA